MSRENNLTRTIKFSAPPKTPKSSEKITGPIPFPCFTFMYYLFGESKGVTGTRIPSGSKFFISMQFLATKFQNNRLAHWVKRMLAHSHGNPGSTLISAHRDDDISNSQRNGVLPRGAKDLGRYKSTVRSVEMSVTSNFHFAWNTSLVENNKSSSHNKVSLHNQISLLAFEQLPFTTRHFNNMLW